MDPSTIQNKIRTNKSKKLSHEQFRLRSRAGGVHERKRLKQRAGMKWSYPLAMSGVVLRKNTWSEPGKSQKPYRKVHIYHGKDPATGKPIGEHTFWGELFGGRKKKTEFEY